MSRTQSCEYADTCKKHNWNSICEDTYVFHRFGECKHYRKFFKQDLLGYHDALDDYDEMLNGPYRLTSGDE